LSGEEQKKDEEERGNEKRGEEGRGEKKRRDESLVNCRKLTVQIRLHPRETRTWLCKIKKL
jgi:hypothetical protein